MGGPPPNHHSQKPLERKRSPFKKPNPFWPTMVLGGQKKIPPCPPKLNLPNPFFFFFPFPTVKRRCFFCFFYKGGFFKNLGGRKPPRFLFKKFNLWRKLSPALKKKKNPLGPQSPQFGAKNKNPKWLFEKKNNSPFCRVFFFPQVAPIFPFNQQNHQTPYFSSFLKTGKLCIRKICLFLRA